MVGTTTFDFDGESAIVTGSTSGIGRGIAKELAKADANVVVNSRTKSDVEETATDLNELGEGNVIGVAADLSQVENIDHLIDSAIDAFEEIDLLVNNAAMWPMEDSMVDADIEDWDQTMDVNVRAQFYTSNRIANHMIEMGIEGAIVNVTSQTGDRRTGNRGIYGVSNTAVNGLTWRMAGELAEHGIRMNAVSTDLTETRQVRLEAELEASKKDTTKAAILDEWAAGIPLGQLGQPEDLANAVLFLASDRANYIVGTTIRVSGGGNLQ